MQNKIEKLISNGKLEEAMDLIGSLGETGDQSNVEFLLSLLNTTKSHALRNEIAIALKDIGDNRAVYPLLEALQNPENIKSRGTLLYALEDMDYKPFIEMIVPLIGDTNFEVSRHSFLLLEKLANELNEQQKIRCKESIIQCKALNTNGMFDEALDLLNS